jgi:phospholipid/cholesterol/gamma-HCH transport system permease protein
MLENKGHININEADPENVKISFSGRVDFHTTANLWRRCMKMQQRLRPKTLTIDMHNVEYCDGAGIGLLIELKTRQHEVGHQFQVEGLDERLQQLMAIIVEEPHKPEQKAEPLPYRVTVTIGRYTVEVLNNIRDNIVFIGMIAQQLCYTLLHPKSMRWQDFFRTLDEVGPNALALIVLIGFLVGLITAFQSAIPLAEFGARIYIANLVGIALMREMGPLMTAVLLAGRTASAFAAELGTMKINQEIDALTTMGLDPIRFLVTPRILAAALMTPLLSLFLIFFGLIGCGIVMKSLGFNYNVYTHQLYSAVHFKDFMGGFVKTFVFGVVISAIGCLHGLKTRFGASAVGYSTTQAVVSGIIMIVVIDGIFSCVYYVLGI